MNWSRGKLEIAMNDELIAVLAEQVTEQVIGWRRQIHEHPEAGFEEINTSDLAARLLSSVGCVVRSGIAKTGAVGLLRGGRPGPTVALRADMDSLPIAEDTGLPWASRVPGRMHACGHDGHVAMLMGAAWVLSQVRDDLPGNVKFIFQPSEERDGGAAPMIDAGVLEEPHVDAIFATHLWPDVPFGSIRVHRGPAMASLDEFSARIHGRGGHVATPHKSVDAISAAGTFITQLQTIVSREIDPTEPVVVSVGRIEGGTAYNAIADEVFMNGTVRVVNPSLRQVVKDKIEARLRGVAEATGTGYDYDYHFGYPPVVNSTRMAEFVNASAGRILGNDHSGYAERPSLVGEDFAYFAQQAPGAIFLLGVGDELTGCYPLHHPKFTFNEAIMTTGVRLHAQLAVDFLFRDPE
ncbi:MAG: amidohydrolase [Clostridia bacterium]|nr:amidohydrolase [Clostridia bacterium]